MKSFTMCRSTWVAVLVLTFLVVALPAGAEVKRIVIDRKVSPAFDGRSYGSAGQYETLAGRAFGELDPNDPHNRVITDIHLAPRNRNGRVEYVASFFIVKPIDMTRSSRLMWHDVPNRAGRVTIPEAERALGDIGLSSGWQGDSAGNTVPGDNNDYAIVPVAKNPDGSPITGLVMGRIVNASGLDSRPMICNYAGGMIPFAATRAERLASGDPRLSVEERYGTHAGYVDAVRAAAAKAVGQGFLLQADADALIAQAAASSVLATVQTAQAQAC